MTIFEERTTSSFGISIPTGIMLESLFDPTDTRYDDSRDIPNKVNPDKYRYHVYNLGTITRNILNAVGHKYNMSNIIMDKNFVDTLISELYVLKSLYENTKCELIFFLPDYNKVYRNINIDDKLSKKYIEYSIAYNILLSVINTNDYKSLDINTIVKDYTLYQLERKDTLLTSHIGVDLLNHKHFSKLHLLESHTGILKQKDKYYTKFHKLGKNDLSHIPFLEECVFVLGDGIVSNSFSLFLRRQFYEISLKSNWKFTTNTEKVRSDMKKVNEFKELLTKLKKSYKG